jgi:hypothetical protein
MEGQKDNNIFENNNNMQHDHQQTVDYHHIVKLFAEIYHILE